MVAETFATSACAILFAVADSSFPCTPCDGTISITGSAPGASGAAAPDAERVAIPVVKSAPA